MDVFFKIQTLFLDWICYWPFSGKTLIYISMQNAHTVYPESRNRYLLVCNYCAYGYFESGQKKMDSHFWIDVLVYLSMNALAFYFLKQNPDPYWPSVVVTYPISMYIYFFHDRLTKPNKENFCRTFRALNLL